MQSRIGAFAGSQDEYVAYLETLVRTKHCGGCSQLAATAAHADHGSPVTSHPNAQQGEHGLQVIQWRPDLPSAKRVSTEPPAWRDNAKELVNLTPTAEDWPQKMFNLGFRSAMIDGTAATFLLDPNRTPSLPTNAAMVPTPRANDRNAAILAGLTAHAHAVVQRSVCAKVALALVNFHNFLVLSACVVLSQEGIPERDVLEIVRICHGRDTISDKYCKQNLRIARFLNELTRILSDRGWNGRATELLLQCMWLLTTILHALISR